jgi:hypothetical protein
MFGTAIAIDPSCAPAYAGLADPKWMEQDSDLDNARERATGRWSRGCTRAADSAANPGRTVGAGT